MKPKKKQDVNEVISKIVDRVLLYVFGEEGSKLIYAYLESNYSVRRNEIGDKIELFARGLEDFLKSGARIIERKILEDICSCYGQIRTLEIQQMDEFDFAHQVKLLMGKT